MAFVLGCPAARWTGAVVAGACKEAMRASMTLIRAPSAAAPSTNISSLFSAPSVLRALDLRGIGAAGCGWRRLTRMGPRAPEPEVRGRGCSPSLVGVAVVVAVARQQFGERLTAAGAAQKTGGDQGEQGLRRLLQQFGAQAHRGRTSTATRVDLL